MLLAASPGREQRRLPTPGRGRDQGQRVCPESIQVVEEARALRQRWDPSLPAFSAIGYAESWALLDGEVDRETAIERDVRRNIAFAKRQRTWFRAEPAIAWLDAERARSEATRMARELTTA